MAAAIPFINAAGTALGVVQGVKNLFGSSPGFQQAIANGISPGLGAAMKIINAKQTSQTSQTPQALSYAEATQRAKDVINPLYDEQLQKTLRDVDNANLARGFFGQLPGAVLSGNRALDVERARAGAIADLANKLVSGSEANALQRQQLANQLALGQQQLQQQGSNNLWNNIFQGAQTLGNLATTYSNITGKVPFTGQTSLSGVRANYNTMNTGGTSPVSPGLMPQDDFKLQLNWNPVRTGF